MKKILLMACSILLINWSYAQISERLFDFGVYESILGVAQLPTGDILLSGFSGEEPTSLQARLTKFNSHNGVVFSDIFGDKGKSKYTSVTTWLETPIATGGLVNDNLGPKTNFNAVTYKANGVPDVIFETAASMGGDNIARDIEMMNNGYFVACGEIIFDFGAIIYKTPYALIALLDPNNHDVINLDSWDVGTDGLGAFTKVVVENESSIFLLFEEEDSAGKTVGYKVFNYALPSGEMLHSFTVNGMSKVNDFSLSLNGSSFLFGGEGETGVAKILEVELDGVDIRSIELNKQTSSLKTIGIWKNRIIGGGEVFTGNQSHSPFIWQLNMDLEEICYNEFISENESTSLIHDMLLTESGVITVGSKLENGKEQSALWEMPHCTPNSVHNNHDHFCDVLYQNGCFTISCLESVTNYRLRLFDVNGRLLAEGVPYDGSWCPRVDKNQIVAYQLINPKNQQVLAGGKLKVLD